MTQIRKATRQKSKLRLGLSGPSGSGKTYTALLIAFGICGDWSKIGIVDSENGSADLYAHLGEYNVITLASPFTTEKYVEAYKEMYAAGMDVVITDSITHHWEELLKQHGAMQGNSFTNWAKITPRYEAFVQAVLQSPVHMITTVRRKQEYELTKDGNGKASVQKLGMKEVAREGWEYELTVNIEIDTNHYATASKDRTGLFAGKPEFIPTSETGKLLKEWCESGAAPISIAPEVKDNRETLTLAHPSYLTVKDAIVNKGFTGAQYATKFIFSKEAAEDISAAKSAPVQVTQQMIHESNSPQSDPF